MREWNECSRQINKLRRRPGNYLVIRYEDLVRQTRQVMEEVCRFAGIEFFPTLLEPTRVGLEWQGNSACDSAFSGIQSNRLDQWKKELTQDEIWWIEMHCREGMRIAGYEPQSDAKFCLPRWAKRLAGESLGGYLRARKEFALPVNGRAERLPVRHACQGLQSRCRLRRQRLVFIQQIRHYLSANWSFHATAVAMTENQNVNRPAPRFNGRLMLCNIGRVGDTILRNSILDSAFRTYAKVDYICGQSNAELLSSDSRLNRIVILRNTFAGVCRAFENRPATSLPTASSSSRTIGVGRARWCRAFSAVA